MLALFDRETDPEELKSVYAQPSYTAIRRTLEEKLAALRTEYAVPSADPALYYPWELPPEYRRPGTPGNTRNSEIGAEGMIQQRH